ncbi:MAG: Crp/Fnr family transcriptional regulator [Chloroflexota bacterium]
MTNAELASHPFLLRLDAPTRQALEAELRRYVYQAGQIIALEGDPCQRVGLLARGLVRERHVSLGGRQYTLAYRGPGAVLGLAAAIAGGPYPATVDALNEVVIYALPAERLVPLMSAWPDLATVAAQHLADEALRLSQMVKELALHDVRTRLARFLLQHAERSPSQRHWTQEAIAEQIGTVRDVVGRALRALSDEGLVRREGGRLVILDRPALEREAALES